MRAINDDTAVALKSSEWVLHALRKCSFFLLSFFSVRGGGWVHYVAFIMQVHGIFAFRFINRMFSCHLHFWLQLCF